MVLTPQGPGPQAQGQPPGRSVTAVGAPQTTVLPFPCGSVRAPALRALLNLNQVLVKWTQTVYRASVYPGAVSSLRQPPGSPPRPTLGELEKDPVMRPDCAWSPALLRGSRRFIQSPRGKENSRLPPSSVHAGPRTRVVQGGKHSFSCALPWDTCSQRQVHGRKPGMHTQETPGGDGRLPGVA